MNKIIQNKAMESKRWLIASAAIIAQLCLGTVHAWSAFKKPMMASHNWTETSTQLTYMIVLSALGIATILGGTLVDKKGPKFTLTLGGILFGIGTLITGLADQIGSLWLLYFGYGICGGTGIGLGYVAPIATLIRWFPDKRGLVTGLAVMGFGAGSFFMGMIAPTMIIKIGIANTFYISGVIFLIVIIAGAQLHIDPPQGWLPAGFKPSESSASSAKSFTFKEAVRWPQWWLLWIMLFLNLTAGFGLISQLSPLAQDVIRKAGSTVTNSALAIAGGTIMAVAMIFNGLGRLLWSWLSDTIGRKTVFIMIFLTQAILYFYLPQVTNVTLFTIIACYLLACFGGILATTPALATDFFGPNHIGKIYGMLLTAATCSGIIGPLIFAQTKDLCLYIAGGMLTLGFILAVSCKKPMAKNHII